MGDAYKMADWYDRPMNGHSEEDSEDDESDESDGEAPDQDGKEKSIDQQKVNHKQKAGYQTGALEASKKKQLSDGKSDRTNLQCDES